MILVTIADVVNASLCSGVFAGCPKYSLILPAYEKWYLKNMQKLSPIAHLPTISQI